MNIVYCIPSLYNSGGMERVLTTKVNYLSTCNPDYNITIITTDQMGRYIFFKLNSEINVVHFDINFSESFNSSLLKRYFWNYYKSKEYKNRLYAYLVDNNIDICISLCGKEMDFLTKLKDKSKKIAELHFAKSFRKQFVLSRKNNLFWRIFGELRTYQLIKVTQKLSKLIVLTKEDKLEWLKTNTNVKQIYNPIQWENSQLSDCINKKMIAVGRLDAQKGYDMLIPIWKTVSDKYPDWELNIFGDGEWKDMLNELIKSYNLVGKVNLKGITNNIQKEYLQSSCFLLSSRYEGFGMVILEAMTFGLPIVSFNCKSGPSELIVEGENGFLIEEGYFNQFSNRICEIIENEDLRYKMSKKSYELSKEFSVDSIMKEWINLFDSYKINI